MVGYLGLSLSLALGRAGVGGSMGAVPSSGCRLPTPPPLPPQPPPPPGINCDPAVQPPQLCPGNVACPPCGQPVCPCPAPAPPAPRFPIGVTAQYDLPLTDPGNLTFSRSYMLHLPRTYGAPRTPVPLVMYFHMQMNDAADDATNYNFTQMSDSNGFAIVLPQGVGDEDASAQSCSTGWNIDGTGAIDTCTKQTWSQFGCSCSCCYKSCQQLGKCTADGQEAQCGWTTCADDVFFTEKLISHLSAEFCIDTSKIFAIGASNGGMFVHHIAKALPNTFRAVMPIYGLPLIGRGLQPAGLASTSFLSLHDRWDNVIPIEGGLSSQGWRYESLAAVLANWTQLHGCGKTHASAVPPYRVGFARRARSARLPAACYPMRMTAAASRLSPGLAIGIPTAAVLLVDLGRVQYLQ
eukprot:COSAG05_NODE_181_length_14767_cov_9.554859_9_plen_408_part_00